MKISNFTIHGILSLIVIFICFLINHLLGFYPFLSGVETLIFFFGQWILFNQLNPGGKNE